MRIHVYAENISLFNTLKNPAITLKNKHKGPIWLASVEGINDKDAADAMKGTKLYCDRSAFPALPDNEIYHVDLVGMTCVTTDGEIIGTVMAVENFGAGDILDIKPANGGNNYYLSYDDKTVLTIDDKITVSMPEVI